MKDQSNLMRKICKQGTNKSPQFLVMEVRVPSRLHCFLQKEIFFSFLFTLLKCILAKVMQKTG